MKKELKRLLTVLGIGITYGFTTGVFAHDCELITNNTDIKQTSAYKSFTTNIQGKINIEEIMPSDAISRALINLKKACCISQSINKKGHCEGFTDTTKFPNSVYFFDHMIDVQLRRLDGETHLAYGGEIDPVGRQRRLFIKKAAEAKNGEITAKTITEQRSTYWKRKYVYDKNISKEFQELTENYPQLSLADRYYVTCDLISEIIGIGRNIRISDVYKKRCRSIVEKRVAKEKEFTTAIMMKKSNEFLHYSTDAYIQKYLVQDKTMALLGLVNKVKSVFSTMTKQAPIATSCKK